VKPTIPDTVYPKPGGTYPTWPTYPETGGTYPTWPTYPDYGTGTGGNYGGYNTIGSNNGNQFTGNNFGTGNNNSGNFQGRRQLARLIEEALRRN